MTKKSWIVNELDTSNINSITLSYVDDSNQTHTLTYSKDDIVYAMRIYYDWTFLDYTGSVKASVLSTNLTKWLTLHLDRFNRLFRALDEKYNPIENYAKHGHIETRYGHVIDNRDDIALHKVTTVPNEIVTSTKERASDSSTLTETMEVTTKATANVGGTSTSDAFIDEHKETHSGTDTIEDTTHGNIGTMLSATAILEEFKVRRDALLDIIISDFMNDNAYYCVSDLF